jgi:two-component system CheB/CheR fusion protein
MAKKKAPSKGQRKAASAKSEGNDAPSDESMRDTSSHRRPPPNIEAAEPGTDSPAEVNDSPQSPVIVGIGSSAGGLNAVSELLRYLPPDTNMTFAVVQHLDPHHESAMAELLARETKMPVTELTDGTTPQPNHVYIIAPNRSLVFTGGLLQLQPRKEGPGYYMPIDRFFRSLAGAQKSRSVGIVLSGSGSDGVVGLQAIKAEGGITFAQDDSAAHSGMPRSAVAAGCVDFVLPPAKIADELARISRHDYLSHPGGDGAPVPAEKADDLQDVIRYLQKACGIDFEHYKQPTLRRRIERRMVLRQFNKLGDYLDCLREDRGEVDSLCQDIFIHVTSFFRDTEVLEVLKKTAFPRLMKDRPYDAPIRIWVPGCSTGEEVYTLAILLLEYLDEIGARTPIKIFATDIADAAIVKARNGVYLESMVTDVSPERLKKFFIKREEGYQITKSVRDMCVFARHDVTKDPPFSQLDLISCRNVLIYLGHVLQQRVLLAFHYGLKQGGFLLLGTSESVGTFTELYETVDKRVRLYAAKPGKPRTTIDFGSGTIITEAVHGRGHLAPNQLARTDVQREADRLMLAKYAPAGVVVDEGNQVVQFRGQTGRYLEPPTGVPTMDVLKMAREGMLVDLRRALEEARATNDLVRREGVEVKTNDHFTTVNIEVFPVTSPSTSQRHFMVVFEDPSPPRKPAPPAPPAAKRREKALSGAEAEIAKLRDELVGTKAYLQSIVEEYEASNEELKAANEEVVSSNEELQSTYEELETAKEELQATNEELSTINDELQSRVISAGQLNDDLTNLIESVNIPIAILDRDLKLRRFTPAAQRLLNLIPTDVGRPISDIRPKVDIPDWDHILRDVQDTLTVKNREVRDEAGRWYAMTVRPYKTQENKISGTVVTLVDIDELKRKEEEIAAARDYASSIVETAPTPLLVLDMEFRIRTANHSFCNKYQVDPVESRGHHLFGLGAGEWNFPRLRELLVEVRDRVKSFDNVEAQLDLVGLGRRTILLTGRAMKPRHSEKPEYILLAIEDITDRRRGEAMQEVQHKSIRVLATAEGLAEATGKLLHVLVDSLDFEFGQVWMVDETSQTLRCSDYYSRGVMDSAGFEKYSQSTKLAVGEDFPGIVWRKHGPVWLAKAESNVDEIGARLASLSFKTAVGFPIVWRNKVCGAITLYSRHYREANEMTLREFTDMGTQLADFVERDHNKASLLDSEARLRAIVETAAEGIITIDGRGAIESINNAAQAMFGYRPEDAVGHTVSDLIPVPLGQVRNAPPEAFQTRVEHLSRAASEGLGRHRSGRTFPILIAVNQVPLGRRQLYTAIIHDMSIVKEAEARALQSERLAVIGELSAGLAHESRNALQRSQSCLEMLQHEVREQPKAMELIDRIQKAQDYLLQLYEGVRNYAAPIHVERSRIDLANLAQTVWDDMEPTRERPGMRIGAHPSARLVIRRDGIDPHCFADPVRMGQVFRNLFENSLAACGEPCEVTVSFADEEHDGHAAMAAIVEDNGPGIPADLQPKVFQPFFTTKSRGSGLGLAITKRIVEAHQGTIRLESNDEPTSRFVIALPRLRPMEAKG